MSYFLLNVAYNRFTSSITTLHFYRAGILYSLVLQLIAKQNFTEGKAATCRAIC